MSAGTGVGPARAAMSPAKFLMVILLSVAIVLGLGAAGVVAYGRDAFWETLFGPPDLGPYDFDAPTRTGKLNDALFCPEGSEACFHAGLDRRTPVFAVDAATLYGAARALVMALPGAEVAEEDAARFTLRAVVRTPLMRFPDTLSLRVRQNTPGTAVLWLYSRSQIGHSDLGTNERRLRHMLRSLRRTVPLAPAGG